MSYPTAINHKHAIQLIKESLADHKIKTETISLADAAGRILNKAVIAPNNVPEFNCSRMDGYAVNLNQISQKSSEGNFYRCEIGEPIHAKAQSQLAQCNNQAVPVMTGALLPVDCNAIIIKENSRRIKNHIEFEKLPIEGMYIREAGSDLQKNQLVMDSDQLITAAHLGLLSSLGVNEVVVSKKPVVGLFITGDEIIELGKPCLPGQFYDANSLMLKQLLSDAGCDVKNFPVIGDDFEHVTNVFNSSVIHDCDIVITVGGVSMGDKDWIPQVVDKLGEIVFHKVKVKPGFPVLFGKIKQALFFGLPGNPVSAFTTTSQYVLTAIRLLLGYSEQSAYFDAELLHDWQKSHDRREFLRGFYVINEFSQLQVKVCGGQQSSRIESLSEANCFIELSESIRCFNQGDKVTIQPFQQFSLS